MSAMRFGVPLCLLLASCMWASDGGVLIGTVRDEITGKPLVGASVSMDGTELGNATDARGSYAVIQIPETTWTATASCLGYLDATLPFTVAEGCTARTDFNLIASYAGGLLTDSGLALYYQRTRNDTLGTETLVAPGGTNDSGALGRCSRTKLSLLARYRQGKDTWAALEIGPYDLLTRRRLDIGPGFCYYRVWRESPPPTANPSKTERREFCGGGVDLQLPVSKVE
jgi:hypothetical protein